MVKTINKKNTNVYPGPLSMALSCLLARDEQEELFVLAGAEGEQFFTAANQAAYDREPSTQPPLGSKCYLPAEKHIDNLPQLSRSDAALLKLLIMIKKAGSSEYLFDQVVSFMETHVGSTFKQGKHIDRKESLFRQIKFLFPVPEPEPVVVPLEHDAVDSDAHQRRLEDTVMVQ